MEARWGGVVDRRLEAWWARCRAVTSRDRFLVVFMALVVVVVLVVVLVVKLVLVVVVHPLGGPWTL